MRQHIQQLRELSRRAERRILGLMSGTSLDGLDLALCRIGGSGLHTRVQIEHFTTLPYTDSFKHSIGKVFAKPDIRFQDLVLLHVQVAEQHAEMVNQCLQEWGTRPDLIASHGQTVFHAPRRQHGLSGQPNATLQIGDGDHLAVRTGLITLSDFRQKQLAAGGEGAPLALYGDYLLFSKRGEDRILLNIGGIANFTFLPGNSANITPFATDTGPGNTLMDAWARQHFGVPYDRDGLLAERGVVHRALVDAWKQDPYFAMPAPKTTGPEHFNLSWMQGAIADVPAAFQNPYDVMASLARLSAETIAEAIARTPGSARKRCVYLSGGGAHNPMLVNHLRTLLPACTFQTAAALGIDGDAKEAVLFAVLANETIAGKMETPPFAEGLPWVSMGKISFPE